MDEDNQAAALALGLTPSASAAEVQAAYQKLLAFWSDEETLSEPLKKLAADMLIKIEKAYTCLSGSSTKKSGIGASTASGGTEACPGTQTSEKDGGKKQSKILAWILVGVAMVFVIGWIGDFLKQKKEPTTPQTVQPQQIEQAAPSYPPDYVKAYLHNGISDQVAKWTTEDISTPGSTRAAISGLDSHNRLVNYLVFYSDDGGWHFYEQYIARYSGDGLQVGVEHFQPAWQSGSIVFADRRNVSEVGDVLVHSTVYYYHLSGSKLILDSVVVSTPFSKNTDGLQYKRDANNNLVSITRQPNGSPIRLDANVDNLPHIFDLWLFFGQYS